MTQAAGKADANQKLAYLLLDQLKSNDMFVGPNTTFQGKTESEGLTFTFQVLVALKHPLKL